MLVSITTLTQPPFGFQIEPHLEIVDCFELEGLLTMQFLTVHLLLAETHSYPLQNLILSGPRYVQWLVKTHFNSELPEVLQLLHVVPKTFNIEIYLFQFYANYAIIAIL